MHYIYIFQWQKIKIKTVSRVHANSTATEDRGIQRYLTWRHTQNCLLKDFLFFRHQRRSIFPSHFIKKRNGVGRFEVTQLL